MGAYHFGIEKVTLLFGRNRATALFSMVVKTLENTGFQIEKLSDKPCLQL